MSDIPDNAPAPRLCIIVKWPDFEGYGFNLHAEKSKPGQYIGKVDPDSPAELAGLLEGDRIVEVNGVNIANENHKQVVQRIKSIATETRLLVLDPKADKYYKSKNIVVRGTQENVIVKTSARDRKINTTATTQHVVDDEDDDNAPPLPSTPQPVFGSTVTNGHHHHDDADNRSVSSAASSSAASEASTQPQSPMSTSPTPPPSLEPTPAPAPVSAQTPAPNTTPVPATTTPVTTTTTPVTSTTTTKPAPQPVAKNNYNTCGLNLNMSAAEMRAKLARKKKADPRNDSLDLRKKYEIIQNM